MSLCLDFCQIISPTFKFSDSFSYIKCISLLFVAFSFVDISIVFEMLNLWHSGAKAMALVLPQLESLERLELNGNLIGNF